MPPTARVTSLEALVQFKADVTRFGVDAGNALAGLDMQIQRAFDWLESQGKFWQREIRRREELVIRAKGDLLQRKASGKKSGRGTTEPELALEKAQEELKEAQTRFHNCRRWAVLLPQEVIQYETPARQLTSFVETELRRAVTLLEMKIRTLEEYVALTAPSAPVAGPAPAEKGPEPTGSPGPYPEDQPPRA